MDTPLTCFLTQALTFQGPEMLDTVSSWLEEKRALERAIQKEEIEVLHQKLAAATIANAESVKKINTLRNKLCDAYIASAGAATIAPAASAARIPMNPEDDEEEARQPRRRMGPPQWNAFVNITWREMAANKGVLFDADAYDAEKAFKKAAAAVGVTYQGALKEASRRCMEGCEVAAKPSFGGFEAALAAERAAVAFTAAEAAARADSQMR